jgi:hypothetical protein
VKAGLRQFGCDDAPDQPDRKSYILGNNRPDQIASGDEFALGVPEPFILGIPVRNPSGSSLVHGRFSLGSNDRYVRPARFSDKTKKPQPVGSALALPADSGVAWWPIVGPSGAVVRSRHHLGLQQYKLRASARRSEKKELYQSVGPIRRCCAKVLTAPILIDRFAPDAAILCSAKNRQATVIN